MDRSGALRCTAVRSCSCAKCSTLSRSSGLAPCSFSNSSCVRYFLFATGVLADSYAFFASALGSPVERTRTVMLAISDGLIGPADREFGSNVRLLPGKGVYVDIRVLLCTWNDKVVQRRVDVSADVHPKRPPFSCYPDSVCLATAGNTLLRPTSGHPHRSNTFDARCPSLHNNKRCLLTAVPRTRSATNR